MLTIVEIGVIAVAGVGRLPDEGITSAAGFVVADYVALSALPLTFVTLCC